ncbi:bacillithiol biosynthesis cysteine-adding enzyme BshC [Bacillus oleivorans]|uniref:Putative cysteine ligase BshC n=1 Tax=Bacillus oleivorans TaxID=1448271 RepID=A0A285D262_9BACI|nr:bacillithiol biosynthesis cysteine-adding enzyme BshC [Bacillus oleivorans]SNX73416.1 bacillithiol biosynthesis cysteine-adding enzyme BshC [Bacillus oleivorans]
MQYILHKGIAGNRLAQDYMNKKESVLSLFPYHFGKNDVLSKRWESLKNRSYPRKELKLAIQDYMEPFGLTPEIEQSLHRLENTEATVIIGGQQAGLLGGPLYTIHKIFALIKHAQMAEKELGKPVVPVFWIAGEDHDYEEVNHVFIRNGFKWNKSVYPEKLLKKKMISEIPLNQSVSRLWVLDVLRQLGETPYTAELHTFLNTCIKQANTFTEFFTAFIHSLFKDYGLLLIDACHPALRKLEQSLFVKIVEEGHQLAADIANDQAEIGKLGYKPTLELDPQTIHLFITDHGERELLFYDKEQNLYYTKSGSVKWSKDELLAHVEQYPQHFSNNVATRPLSQEFLFPTLGFVGGPGEIAYWCELRSVFKRFDLDMAPVIPRMQITYLESSVMKKLQQYNIHYEAVLNSGIKEIKDAYLKEKSPIHLFESVERTSNEIRNKYEELVGEIKEFDRGLLPILHKNEKFVIDQLHFLEQYIWKQLEKRNDKVLTDFDELDAFLHPFGGLQERIWNVCYFINQYGFDWLKQVMSLELESGANHYVISF